MSTAVLHSGAKLYTEFRRSLLTALISISMLCGRGLSQGQKTPGKPAQIDPQRVADEANRSLAAGDYGIAERDYKSLLSLGIHNASIYSNLAVVYLRTGRLNLAIEALLKAKELAPQIAGIRLNLGLAYFRRHDFKAAGLYFGDALAADPHNVQARYLRGVCYFMLDNFAGTISDFEPIKETERNDLEFLFMLGTSYGMLKRNYDSLRIFQQMVDAGGNSAHLHLLLGKAYLALGQYENAEQELNRANESETLPFAHYYLGVLKRELGHPDQAAAEYQREIEIDPLNIFAYKDLAEIRLEQANPQAAIAVLKDGTAKNPSTPELLATLGRAYLQTTNDNLAIVALKKAIELSPQVSSYHYQLGRAYLKVGRRAEASAEMARARLLTSAEPEGKMRALSRDEQATGEDGIH